MSVSKKTTKKTSGKKSRIKKTMQTAQKIKGKAKSLKQTSKKLVDQVLVKIQPPLQKKIDHLIQTLEHSKEGRLGDLSLLAGKILIRAQDISKNLRHLKAKK